MKLNRSVVLVVVIFLLSNSLFAQTENVPVMDFDTFEPYLHQNDKEVYVINFWATWCKPCIKELPYFEGLREKYKDRSVHFVLVNLDFSDKLDRVVLPFIEKHQLASEIVLLDDVDSNRWIPIVSEEWSGAIPATLIYNSEKRTFYEGSFTYESLETAIKNHLP